MFDYKRVFGTKEEEDRYRANYDQIDWADGKKANEKSKGGESKEDCRTPEADS